MPVRIRPRSLKPAFGPLHIDVPAAAASGLVAAWLFNEGGGPAYSLIDAEDALVLATAATWGTSLAGPAVVSNANSSYARLSTPSTALKPVVAVSLLWHGSFIANGTLASSPRIASMNYDAANGSPFVSYGIFRTSTAADVSVGWNNGSFQSLTMTGGIDTGNYGRLQSLGLAMDGASMRGFVDGVFKTSSTSGVGAITYGATAELDLGAFSASGDYASVKSSVLLIWNRKLADAEFLTYHADPIAALEPFVIRRWRVAAGGGTTTPLSIAGAMTPSAVLIKAANKAFTGGATPAGALTKATAAHLAAGATPAGVLAKQANKPFSGGATPAGGITKQARKALAGAVTPAASLAKQVSKALSGAISSIVGALSATKAASVSLSGSMAPAGALTKSANKSLSGVLASAGTVRDAVAKHLFGALTPAGSLADRVSKALSGLLTTAGALSAVFQAAGAFRDLTFDLRPPEHAWQAFGPIGKWASGGPLHKWLARPPQE